MAEGGRAGSPRDTMLVFLKPDVYETGKIGAVIQAIRDEGIQIMAMKMMQLSKEQAGAFYRVHEGRPFFADLVKYVTRGPVVPMVLKRENAVETIRTLMGATNPQDAAEGTLRKMFGTSLDANVLHGSDCDEAAEREIAFFFSETEIPVK